MNHGEDADITLDRYAQVRRRDLPETEQYIRDINALDAKILKKLKRYGLLEAQVYGGIEQDIKKMNDLVTTFVSEDEKKKFQEISQARQDRHAATYIAICDSDKPLSIEEKLVHKYYVYQYAMQYSSIMRNRLDNAIKDGWRRFNNARGTPQEYRAENNGKYPLRKNGKSLYIKWIAEKSFQSRSGREYPSDDSVRRFYDKSLTEDERAKLYDGSQCGEFEGKHMRCQSERIMKGHNTVVFTRDHNGDECMGIYGGERSDIGILVHQDSPDESERKLYGDLLASAPKNADQFLHDAPKGGIKGKALKFYHDDETGEYRLLSKDEVSYAIELPEAMKERAEEFHFQHSPNAAYVLEIHHPDTKQLIGKIAGDNILSRVDTSYAFDDAGLPVAQAKAGYNVDVALFKVQLEDDSYTTIHAFFGKGKAGENARWNYGQSEQTVKALIRLDYIDRLSKMARGTPTPPTQVLAVRQRKPAQDNSR